MLMEREEFADADALLSRVFQLDPSDPRTAQMLVRAKLALQQWNEAKAVVARVAPGDENSALASTYIDGLALQAGGDYTGSTRAFERLLGQQSSSGVAIKGIARNFRLMDAPPDAAREYFEKLIEMHPDQQQAYLSLAEQYSALRRWDEATKVLRTAIARHADWIPVYRALATVQIARGDLDGALATQRRIVKRVPDDVEARLYVAGIVEKQGKLAEATRLYGEVLDLDSGNDIAANNLAALLIHDGKPDAETLDRAYALARRFESTRVPEFADTLGWIYVLRNNYPKGIEYLERASAGAPNSAEIQYHLGAAYLRSRDASRAKDHLERSLALAETGRQHPAPSEAREMLQQL
jgi:tetratricopeptide (TPR) repeat protein